MHRRQPARHNGKKSHVSSCSVVKSIAAAPAPTSPASSFRAGVLVASHSLNACSVLAYKAKFIQNALYALYRRYLEPNEKQARGISARARPPMGRMRRASMLRVVWRARSVLMPKC